MNILLSISEIIRSCYWPAKSSALVNGQQNHPLLLLASRILLVTAAGRGLTMQYACLWNQQNVFREGAPSEM